jgi:hypothetical protein
LLNITPSTQTEAEVSSHEDSIPKMVDMFELYIIID